MITEFVPVPNQKFDIGRTINPFICDCKQCDFLHCPKNNYAVRMKLKSFLASEFFEEYKTEMLCINPVISNNREEFVLRFSDRLFTEFMDMMSFTFPKGSYWSFDEENQIVLIEKFSRRGVEIVTGYVKVSDGTIIDRGMSQAQINLCEKISDRLKEVKDLILSSD